MTRTSSKLDQELYAWLCDPGAMAIMKAFAASGGEARFVGGCVRDALAGIEVCDIDLAVNMRPDKVIAILEGAGIKVIPTGIEHGTVTAVSGGRAFEITSLRKDVKTDGRHASVDFTDDWMEDASRRDFTINAIYVDFRGNVYDYFNGAEDLSAGRVRFIGDARERIREDVLRILRFFRINSIFGNAQAGIDAPSLRACSELACLIPSLSSERIWSELKKMLLTTGVVRWWDLMVSEGVMDFVLPHARNIDALRRLVEVESRYDGSAAIRRLAALLPDCEGRCEDIVNDVKKRFRISKQEASRLSLLLALPSMLRGNLDSLMLRQLMYEHGKVAVNDAVILLAAIDDRDVSDAVRACSDWDSPVFPLKGADLIKWGLSQGPKLGEVLKAVEDWWKAADFKPGKDACGAEAKRIIETISHSDGD